MKIFTIGHSTRSTRDFMKIMKSFGIDLLVDIRHYPGSHYCPHFGKSRLKRSLKRNGISYEHLVSLGGRRGLDKDSEKNLGWRSPAFRGYADYMQTQEFKQGLKELIDLAKGKNIVIMCAEALPWRCHRSLVADALIAKDIKVEDIFEVGKSRPHKLTPFAKIYRRQVTYPAYEEKKAS